MTVSKVYVGYVVYNLDDGGDYTIVGVSKRLSLIKEAVADTFNENKESAKEMISPDEVSSLPQYDEDGIMAYGYDLVPYWDEPDE